MKVQRSVSQSDVHGNNGRRVRPTIVGNPSTTKLKRCASLPAQKRQIIVNTNVDVKNLKAQLESSVESLGELKNNHEILHVTMMIGQQFFVIFFFCSFLLFIFCA